MSVSISNKINIELNIDGIAPIKTNDKKENIIYFKNESIEMNLKIYDKDNQLMSFVNDETTTYTLTLYCKRPDETFKTQIEDIIPNPNGIITIKLKSYMNSIVGQNQYQLKIEDNQGNVNYLPVIIGNVIDNLFSDESNSNTETITLEELKTEIGLFKDKLEALEKLASELEPPVVPPTTTENL